VPLRVAVVAVTFVAASVVALTAPGAGE